MTQLSTDWLCIATEGDTVDGRFLKRQWLIDAAETYDPNLYGALIWPEHERGFGNLGEVLETMWLDDENGLAKLFGKIRPNSFLIEANQKGQLVYFSIELSDDEDFRGSGRSYLTGLAATDFPASVGTTRMRFSQREKIKSGQYRYVFGRNGKVEKEQNMSWQSLFNIKSKKFEDENQSDNTGEVDKLQALAEAVNDIESRLAAIESQLSKTQDDVDTIAEVVDTQEFATLRDNLPKIVKSFSRLDEKITNLPSRFSVKGKPESKFKFL